MIPDYSKISRPTVMAFSPAFDNKFRPVGGRRGVLDIESSKFTCWYRPRYHSFVANAEKILARMRANPRDWHIDDLKVIAARHGFDYRQHGTSHVVFRHPSAGLLTVPAARPIKPVYIRQFVALVDRARGEE